jgi:hypothetical protein
MKQPPTIQIDLTPEQKEQLRKLTGKEVPRLKLNLEQLEARVAPKLAGN